jgi:hypothetical protein
LEAGGGPGVGGAGVGTGGEGVGVGLGGGGGVGAGEGVGAGGAGCDGGPDCETPTCVPATINFADRSGPAFAATAIWTVSPPLPDEGLGVAHGASLLAVHAHTAAVLTSMAMFPPPAATVPAFGVTTNEQGAASCESSSGTPLIVRVPRRAIGSGF